MHELARKELVRPARVSLIEGESEYSFCICSSAMSPTARSQERSGHVVIALPPPGSSSRLAGESRIWPNCSRTTTCRRSSSPRLPATREQAEELASLLGTSSRSRASGRSASTRPRQKHGSRAHSSSALPTIRSGRSSLSDGQTPLRMPGSRGRPRPRSTRHSTAFRARGEREGEARTLILLADVTFTLGGGRSLALAADAVSLLEQEPPGPTLVAAYTGLAAAHFHAGEHGEAITAADRALALAKRLGLTEPARALGRRGFACAFLGDPGGLAEMERALPMLIEQGAGREAAILQNNLAIARYPLQGPARSLTAFEKGIAFCEQRGLSPPAGDARGRLPRSPCRARPPGGGARAGLAHLLLPVEARGGTFVLIWVRALELATRVDRGESEGAPAVADWLVEAARTPQATPDTVVEALSRRRLRLLAVADPGRACALLYEIEQTPAARDAPYYPEQLAAMLRTALAAGDSELAERLADGLESTLPASTSTPSAPPAPNSPNTPATTPRRQPCTPRRSHAGSSSGTSPNAPMPCSARAAAWSLSQTPPPSNHSARRPSCSASMGYRPALAETEALIAQTTALAS